MLLRSDRSIIVEKYHVWPSLNDKQWIAVEQTLKDLILADFGLKNSVNVNALTQTEIRNIIMGVEFSPISQHKNQIADIEKNEATQLGQMTAVTTKSYDKQGNEIVVTTTSPYEQQPLITKTDWRIRAISAANLHLRINHIYIRSNDIKEDGYTYVIPKNILKKFISVADLRTQIAGLIYGISPPGYSHVKEIRAIVLPPQWGNHQQVSIPLMTPEHELISEFESLGWIHTQPNELSEMSPSDLVTHARMLGCFSCWKGEISISITVAFTPGSCSLLAHRLTAQGYEAARDFRENLCPEELYERISTKYYERVPLLLTNRFKGFYLIPESGGWNYNFRGVEYGSKMKYTLKSDNPKDFYNEIHRPLHFIDFALIENEKQVDTGENYFE
jgi:pre-mRNA-processing factor 8